MMTKTDDMGVIARECNVCGRSDHHMDVVMLQHTNNGSDIHLCRACFKKGYKICPTCQVIHVPGETCQQEQDENTTD
jgi:hypothetical protein